MQKTTTGGTTAIPNILFDELLPHLGDTELRVLLIVARSTLGWKEGAGRKERDWLSHTQLQKRTGRSGAPVSRAVDTLIKRGLLMVQSKDGKPLSTARERRALRSRLFFRLGDALLYSPGDRAKHSSTEPEAGSSHSSTISTSETKGTAHLEPASTLETRLHFLNTTKEIQTKDLALLHEWIRGSVADTIGVNGRCETSQIRLPRPQLERV